MLTNLVPDPVVRMGEPCFRVLTPSQGEGPFYPVLPQKDWPRRSSLYKTHGWPSSLPDRERLLLRVSLRAPRALSSTQFRIQVWHASREGRYHHHRDVGRERLWDPEFVGFAELPLRRGETVEFYSVVPGIYWDTDEGPRPRHVHLKLWSGSRLLLTTQIYFEGDRLNSAESSLQKLPPEGRDRLCRPLFWSSDRVAWLSDFEVELGVHDASIPAENLLAWPGGGS